MNSIHYFQRYSKKEDVVTNNTLLLFSRLYHKSPLKFSAFIKALLNDTELEVGVNFYQQERSTNSVPDGAIVQNSFKVVIETKLSKNFNVKQLVNHFQSFKNETSKILLAISPEKINQNQLALVYEQAKTYSSQNKSRINFIAITFKDIVEKFTDTIDDHDIELANLILDYEEFCLTEGVIPKYGDRMLTVGCSWTLPENLETGIYYDPVDRSYSYCSHLGLYSNKGIRGVGEIVNVIAARLDHDNLEILHTTNGPCTEKQREGIQKSIFEANPKYGWDISEGHKFFCVDKFYETSFMKTTKGGLLGRKYFDLNALLNKNKFKDAQEIAELLSTKEW